VEVLVTVVGGFVIAFVASAVAKWRAECSKEHCVHGALRRKTDGVLRPMSFVRRGAFSDSVIREKTPSNRIAEVWFGNREVFGDGLSECSVLNTSSSVCLIRTSLSITPKHANVR